MKQRLVLALALILLLAEAASAQLTPAARRDSVRMFFADHETGQNHAAAVAKAFKGTDTDSVDIEATWGMLQLLSDMASPDIVERFRLTSAYVLLRDKLPIELISDIELVWARRPVRPFEGDYERVCYYTALYLTTVTFDKSAVWFNGRSREENERDSRSFLLHWMKQTTEIGQEEFDSPTYSSAVFCAMLLLRDHASDASLRQRAELMAQWLLADFAHDYLAGAYAGAHAREHWLSAVQPITSDMSSLAWLYFGDGPQVYSRDQYFAMLSNFEPLPEIIELATSRETAYEAWEQKPQVKLVRDNGLARNSGPMWKYTYMDPLYAIGSMSGGLVQHREQHSWDVTWIPDNPEKPATLFLMQPYSDPNSLTPFLPHTEELALRTTSTIDPYFGTVTKTTGGSPFEDVFQHKNTLIALYDIGTVSRFPVIAGIFPPDVKAMDVDSAKSGWITINTGEVYIAVYPFKRFRMAEGKTSKHFISYDKRNGAIVQVAGRNVAGPYEQFVKRIKATRIDMSRFDSDLALQYITMFGDTLRMKYGAERTVNGAAPTLPSPNLLFSSSRLHSEKGSGILTIRGKASEAAIDMKQLEVRRGS
jgi:hypothetical protein